MLFSLLCLDFSFVVFKAKNAANNGRKELCVGRGGVLSSHGDELPMQTCVFVLSENPTLGSVQNPVPPHERRAFLT